MMNRPDSRTLAAAMLLAASLAAAPVVGASGNNPAQVDASCRPPDVELARNPTSGRLEMNLGNCVGRRQAWDSEFDSALLQGTAFPDFNANYWATGLPTLAGQAAHWEVRGTMPDARFSSLQTYTVSAQTLGFLVDEDYAADPGQVNWIRTGGRYPGAASVRYTVRVREVPATVVLAPGELRIESDGLAAAQAKVAMLAYRVYFNRLPNGSVPPPGLNQQAWIGRGQVSLPQLVYVVDDESAPHFRRSDEIFDRVGAATAVGGILRGFDRIGDVLTPVLDGLVGLRMPLWEDPVRWQINDGLRTNLRPMVNAEEAPFLASMWEKLLQPLPNFRAYDNAASRYFIGGIHSARGEVLVTRFRAPTVADPDQGQRLQPAAESPAQVRYWSACLNNTLTLYVSGCIKDSDAVRDPDGRVTLVISSTEAPPVGPGGQRPANWLRHASPNQLLLVRHMWPSPSFAQAPNYYAGDVDDIAAIRAFSGDYQPVSRYCSLNNYRYNGCNWVFDKTQEWLYAYAPSFFARLYPAAR